MNIYYLTLLQPSNNNTEGSQIQSLFSTTSVCTCAVHIVNNCTCVLWTVCLGHVSLQSNATSTTRGHHSWRTLKISLLQGSYLRFSSWCPTRKPDQETALLAYVIFLKQLFELCSIKGVYPRLRFCSSI